MIPGLGYSRCPKHVRSGAFYYHLTQLCEGGTITQHDQNEHRHNDVYKSLLRFVDKYPELELAYSYAKSAGLMKDLNPRVHKYLSGKAHKSYAAFVENYKR